MLFTIHWVTLSWPPRYLFCFIFRTIEARSSIFEISDVGATLDIHTREILGKTMNMDARRGRKLKVIYANANQFLNNREDLVIFIAGDAPDIIMITEVIPKTQINSIETHLLQLENYDVYVNFDESATNIEASGIRGVAIDAKDDLYVNEVKLNTDFKDHLWVEIHLSRNDSILCGCTYISPTKEKEASLESTNMRYSS